MMFGLVLLELVAKIENSQYTDEIKREIIDRINSAMTGVTCNPRDQVPANELMLNAAVFVILGLAEDYYGAGEDIGFYPHPIFQEQPSSQIAPLLDDHGKFAIVLGRSVKSWEDVFYDICHESLHMLNPILNVKSDGVKVSALEEGVAVKFAEKMYESYIKTYCENSPATSPVGVFDSQYFKAYSAANKIPDEVLKEVRRAFGKFSSVDDVGKFTKFVGDYVNKDEIEILLAPFEYV